MDRPPYPRVFDETAVLTSGSTPNLLDIGGAEGHVQVRFKPHRLHAESDTPMSLVKKVFELEVSHETVCDH